MKRKRNNNFILSYLIVILILCLIVTIIFINYFNKIAIPYFRKYAYRESHRIVSNVINESIINNINEMDTNNLIVLNNSKIDFNTNYVNNYLSIINEDIINNLESLNNNIYYVPLFSVFDNSLLANIGPNIPIKMSIMGDVISKIGVSVNDYGINNMLIELSLNTKITIGINLPFNKEEMIIENNNPISYKIIEGNIPNVYMGGYKLTSNELSNF